MTAEKWLTIGEVKVYQLENYLKNMKTMGYTIIGAEQSKRSISFTDLRFPQKSVLLLG
jgi:tRNA guanosine-2'-O-methyltransferase